MVKQAFDGTIILGVDYYPEHWPESRWEQDARLMADAGLSLVRMGEFAWALFEPEPGRFDFDWLDRALDVLDRYELKAVLGTPTAAPPAWLTAAHPEILPVDCFGHVKHAGTRRHACASAPAYIEASARIVTALARHYSADPRVVGWQIDNEFGCHDTARCYCENCAAGFRRWLADRYGSLDAVNDAWGTTFWSQHYTSWEQIEPPRFAPAEHNPGLLLDWYRFSSDNWVAYQQRQIDILRAEASGRFITHNLMGFFDQLDYYRLAAPLDFVSWDNYHYHGANPTIVAATHDLMWGIKQRNFWVMEQQAGQINWSRYNPAFRSGEARLKSWQAIAHGADGVVYFRWRAATAGSEQYHSGLLDHSARPTRAYHEVRDLAGEIARLQDRLAGTRPRHVAAILHDYSSHWALQCQPHNRDLDTADLSDTRVSESPLLAVEGQPLTGRAHGALYLLPAYEALHRRNIGTTFASPAARLSRYRLVIAPSALHLVDEAIAARLRAYVESGGTLVLGPRAGFKQSDNRVPQQAPQPGLLRELAGVEVEEWDSRPLEGGNMLRFDDGGTVNTGLWHEILTPLSAETLATYTGDYYAGRAAITLNRVGSGRVVYVGAFGGVDLYTHLLARLERDGLALETWPQTPAGVEAAIREDDHGRAVTILLNHRDEPATVTLSAPHRNLLDGTRAAEFTIRTRDVAVLVQDEK